MQKKKRAISEVCPLLYHHEEHSLFELVNANTTHISQNRIMYNCFVINGKLIFKLVQKLTRKTAKHTSSTVGITIYCRSQDPKEHQADLST